MRLVYLWIAEYKNIKNQGFNFSPDFKCEYDEKSSKLTIDENKNYPSIFPSNINVTAIVGENGSGKSSLLEIICECYHIEESKCNIIIVFENQKNDISIITNIDKFDNDNIITKVDYSLETKTKKYLLPLMKSSLFFSLDDEKTNLYYTNPFEPYKNAKININININFSKEKVKHEILYNLFFLFSQKKSIKTYFKNIFYPTTIELNINMFKALKECENNNSELEKIINSCNEEKDGFELLKKSMQFYLSINSQRELSYTTKNSMDNVLEKLKKYLQIEIIKNDLSNDKKSFWEQQSEQIVLKIKIVYEDKEFSKSIKEFLEMIQYINYKNTVNFDIKGTLNQIESVSYNNLSQGQKEIINVLSLIESTFMEKSNKEWIIAFDETFNSLHPNWQKQILSYFIDYFKAKEEEKVHLIFTTHSPFLLSDLPKENIIFLEKGKQVYPDIETFGANIHTLLSHGFFMDNGLMGEFAKSQIDDVINYLNNKSEIKDNDKAQNIINLIGEPIIKRQLQKMLDSKNIDYIANDVKEEIELLKHRISLLSKRL